MRGFYLTLVALFVLACAKPEQVSLPEHPPNPNPWRLTGMALLGDPVGGSVSDLPEPLRVGPGVTPPVVVRRSDPSWPSAKVPSHGEIHMEIIVEENGSVTAARLARGDPSLEDAARYALGSWQFEPATRQGKPVRVIHRVTLAY